MVIQRIILERSAIVLFSDVEDIVILVHKNDMLNDSEKEIKVYNLRICEETDIFFVYFWKRVHTAIVNVANTDVR